jgi:antitoxin component YwqK of YwqJK toxin-antitoxin module
MLKIIYALTTTVVIVFNMNGFAQVAQWNSDVRLYLDSIGNPFSGILYEKVNLPDIDSSKKIIEEGKITTEYGYKNGKIRVEEHVKQGIILQFYKNGKLFTLTNMKNGSNDGKATEWDEDGNIHHITNYKNGREHGLSESFYEDGKIASQFNFIDGQIVGDERHWYRSGQLRKERLNVGIPDKRQEIREYYENGVLFRQWIIANSIEKNYSILTYTNEGKLKNEEIYKNGNLIEERVYDISIKYKVSGKK